MKEQSLWGRFSSFKANLKAKIHDWREKPKVDRDAESALLVRKAHVYFFVGLIGLIPLSDKLHLSEASRAAISNAFLFEFGIVQIAYLNGFRRMKAFTKSLKATAPR